MKILLINPPGWQDGSVSLGLACLSGGLMADGHAVKVLDLTGKNLTMETIAARVSAWKPDIVGFHVKTAQANITSKISRAIKKIYPQALHVAGGPHITLCWQEYMRENLEIEYCFAGEADRNFPEFCRRIEAKSQVNAVPGIAFRKDGAITLNDREIVLELDSLPFPQFDVIEGFIWNGFRYPLLTSRGCPYQCNFCSVPVISSRKFRVRRPEDCVEELRQAKAEKGITTFEILDDNFTFYMDRAKDFCLELIRANLHLSWHCHNGIRADKLDDELARLMKEAGCESVAFGIETGDKEVFQRIHKGETLEDIVRAIGIAKKSGMRTVGYFIIGLPGDSLQATKRTIAFQKSLRLDHYVYGIFIPYPGTKGQEEVLNEGKILRDIRETSHFSDHPEVAVEYPYFKKEEIEEAYYLTSAGDLSDLMEKWRTKGPIENVLYVEMNPPTHAFRRFIRWVRGGIDLLITAAYDGCFEADKNNGSVRKIYSYPHSFYQWEKVRVLTGLFLKFRKRKYNVAFFPFNRRKSVLIAFCLLVGAKHTVLYDFDGSRFVEISFGDPGFRRFLKRYFFKKSLFSPVFFLWDVVSCPIEKLLQRILYLGLCVYLFFRHPRPFQKTEK